VCAAFISENVFEFGILAAPGSILSNQRQLFPVSIRRHGCTIPHAALVYDVAFVQNVFVVADVRLLCPPVFRIRMGCQRFPIHILAVIREGQRSLQ
jgi:hypothetical protein